MALLIKADDKPFKLLEDLNQEASEFAYESFAANGSFDEDCGEYDETMRRL